jgi:hypothetical protein
MVVAEVVEGGDGDCIHHQENSSSCKDRRSNLTTTSSQFPYLLLKADNCQRKPWLMWELGELVVQ